jgi:hypothetical protein
MAIKTELTRSEFTDALRRDEYAAWSYQACNALYDYFEELSEDIGEDIEFDAVTIRCDWNEYTLEDFANDYSNLKEEDETDKEFAERMQEERTQIIWLDNTNIIAQAF